MEPLTESLSEKRNSQFQQSFYPDQLRRKREEGLVELRKQKRSQQIAKKRAFQKENILKIEDCPSTPAEFFTLELNWVSSELSNALPLIVNTLIPVKDRILLLLDYIEALSDISTLFHPIQTLRKILSSEGTPPLNFIMRTGISTKIVALLNTNCIPLQTECLWCILNLATGPSHIVKILIEQNVIPALKLLLSSTDQDLLELTVWCIGNLAGDSVYTRDQLIDLVPSLVKLLQRIEVSRWKNIMWTLSNLCRGKPLPGVETTQQVLSIAPLILNTNDEEMLSDCCWALSYISDGVNQRIQDILDLGVLSTLVNLLSSHSTKVTVPCLRTLGNIVTGNDSQTQEVLNLGLVDKIAVYLSSKKVSLKREALWTLSNITAGSDEQINLVLSHPSIHYVVQSLNDSDFEIKKEALWTISNATHAKSPNLVLRVLELGAFPYLCDILSMKDPKVLLVVLEAINNLLRAGNAFDDDSNSKTNEVALKFDEIGGLSKMEELQEHPNVKIYKKVVEIMEEHYGLIEINDENNPINPELFSFV
jgi:importin subunit alpha-6/7